MKNSLIGKVATFKVKRTVGFDPQGKIVTMDFPVRGKIVGETDESLTLEYLNDENFTTEVKAFPRKEIEVQ